MEVSMHLNMINHNLLQRVSQHKPLKFSKNQRLVSCQLAMHTENGVMTNFYQLLSLNSQKVSFDEIKKAYKTMALQYHPDVCSSSLTKEESTRRFIELRKAYETLSNPKSRRMYDSELGLEDPPGIRFEVYAVEKTREGDFPREVWERQLNGLTKRSSQRMKRRRDE